MINQLSFSHIIELLKADSVIKRDFYQKFRKAPSLQVGDVRNIGVAPL
jgi:hypothetical protein